MLSSRARSRSHFFHVSKPTPLLIEWKSIRAVLRVVSLSASSMRLSSFGSGYTTLITTRPSPWRGESHGQDRALRRQGGLGSAGLLAGREGERRSDHSLHRRAGGLRRRRQAGPSRRLQGAGPRRLPGG